MSTSREVAWERFRREYDEEHGPGALDASRDALYAHLSPEARAERDAWDAAETERVYREEDLEEAYWDVVMRAAIAEIEANPEAVAADIARVSAEVDARRMGPN